MPNFSFSLTPDAAKSAMTFKIGFNHKTSTNR